MRRSRPLVAVTAALVAALVATGPALAYTIYLKDGSRIVARDKYEIRGSLAIVILPSGTASSIPAAEIDVERTEQANQSRLGSTAVVIEGGRATELRESAPPPPKLKLQDLIRSNDGELRGPSVAPGVREALVDTPAAALKRRESARGARAPFPDVALAAELLTAITARGVGGVAVYRSSQAKRPMVVFETATEGSVFKAIVAACQALLQVERDRAGALDGLEVVCETSGGQAAGRFTLTPRLAEEIVTKRYEITRFYVENVQF